MKRYKVKFTIETVDGLESWLKYFDAETISDAMKQTHEFCATHQKKLCAIVSASIVTSRI